MLAFIWNIGCQNILSFLLTDPYKSDKYTQPCFNIVSCSGIFVHESLWFQKALILKSLIKGVVHPAVLKGNIIYPPQSLLLEPNKYSNPILRISVTSNLSKQPPLGGIQSAPLVTTLGQLTIQNIKIVSQFVL